MLFLRGYLSGETSKLDISIGRPHAVEVQEHYEKLVFEEDHVKECVIGEKDTCIAYLLDRWVVQSHYHDTEDDIPYCDGYLLLYSTTSRSSFQDVARTCRQVPLDPKRNPNTVLVLVGTKSDLVSSREVTPEEGAAMAKDLGCHAFIETSAKTGKNVDAAVLAMVQALREAAASREMIIVSAFHKLRELVGGASKS
ncbi:hypothetical protein D9613_010069 [Agrocybe pediades]|uniref:Uncharacterized protein n=1 Tax=Agrocybe pediades TaxID=84607 RepID=A0A8H4VSA1_9AGAR|nr:hypothetical protein D9613_010069 [Agrocybe pediades]